MTIEIHPFSLVVSFPHDVFLHFVIDTTSGKTIVSSSGLGEYAGTVGFGLKIADVVDGLFIDSK